MQNSPVQPVAQPTASAEDKVLNRLVVFMAILFACLRPTVIGSTFSAPISVLLLVADIAIVARISRSGEKLSREFAAQAQLFLLALVAFVLLLSQLSQPKATFDPFKGFGISFAVIASLILILSYNRLRLKFFDTFAFIIVLSSASILFTAVLGFVGLPAMSLVYLHIPIECYADIGGFIAFPFTHLANEVMSWGGASYRLAGIFREPGVFPPFACWAASYAALRKWRLVYVSIPLIASILSMSSIGTLALYTGAVLFLYRMRLHPALALAVIVWIGLLTWPIIYSLDYIGIEAKIDSKSGSYEERESLFLGVLGTQNILFGDGYGWGGVYSTEGISLVSQIRVYGLVYFVPLMAFYMIAARNLSLWIAGCVPALVAVFFSQPISVDPAFLVLFFGWVSFKPTRQPKFNRLRRRPLYPRPTEALSAHWRTE